VLFLRSGVVTTAAKKLLTTVSWSGVRAFKDTSYAKGTWICRTTVAPNACPQLTKRHTLESNKWAETCGGWILLWQHDCHRIIYVLCCYWAAIICPGLSHKNQTTALIICFLDSKGCPELSKRLYRCWDTSSPTLMSHDFMTGLWLLFLHFPSEELLPHVKMLVEDPNPSDFQETQECDTIWRKLLLFATDIACCRLPTRTCWHAQKYDQTIQAFFEFLDFIIQPKLVFQKSEFSKFHPLEPPRTSNHESGSSRTRWNNSGLRRSDS